jgi:hypothetical protein
MSSRNAKQLTEEEVVAMWTLFGPPPVLTTEDPEAYGKIQNGHVVVWRPSNMFHLSLVRELVDTEWEMFRVVRIRTKILNRTYVRRGDKQAMNLLETPLLNFPEIYKGINLLDRLDKWLNTATVRRNNLLKLLEYYCPASDDKTSIPEDENRKVEDNETRQITALPLAPVEPTTNDVTTQN